MIKIDSEKCIGCGSCAADCFPNNIKIVDGKAWAPERRCMECGHCIAICPVNAIELTDYDMSEVRELSDMERDISPEVYLNHIKSRRSIRNFTDKPVSEDELNLLLEVGRYSPTGSNLQNVAYFISRDDIANFKTMIFEELKLMGEESIANSDKNARYAKKWIRMCDAYNNEGSDSLFFDAGTVIVVSSPSPQAAMIAAAHMETMVYSMGLGMLYSGFTTRAMAHSEKLRSYVGLKEEYNVYAVLVIGHPNVSYLRTAPRKKADVTRK